MQILAVQTYKTNHINKQNTSFKELNGANINRAVRHASPVITSDWNEFEISVLKNEKVKSIYKKFAKFYSEQKQQDIAQAFSSCLNGDGTLSKYALRTLNALYKRQYPSFLKNLKYKLLRKYMHGCDSRDSAWGIKLTKIADIINACKDSQNNSNKQNLKFAQQIFIDTPTSRKDIPLIINASKNEEGICTKENIEFLLHLNRRFPQNFSQLLEAMPDKDGKISEAVNNFIVKLGGSSVVNSGGFMRADYTKEVLIHTQNVPNRDEILDFISNSDILKEKCPPVICYIDKDGNINIDYLKKYLEICETKKNIYKFKVPAYIYQSEDSDILNANIEQLSRFSEYYKGNAIEIFAKSKFFKKDGVINKEFVDFIVENDYMFQNPDSYNAYPFIDTSLELSIQKDKGINLEIASLLQNFAYESMHHRILYHDEKGDIQTIKTMMKQACELCKDNDGNFSKSNIIETIKELKYIMDNFYKYHSEDSKSEGENHLREKYLAKIIQNKNLYDTQTLLDILENTGADFKILTAKIPEYENLLFAIADIPPQNNPKAYQKIIDKLNSLENVDFNMKDSNGITFLEKVLNSENKQLLEVISHPSNILLEYSPELEFAYKGIRDIEFRKQVDNKLNLKFPLLEYAVKCYSQPALEKVESQLESPLCNRKKVLEHLWQIAKKYGTKDFCNYFAQKYSNDLPNSVIKDLNKINYR